MALMHSTSMHSTSSLRPEDPQQALRAEQLRLLFETQPFNIAATLTIAAIVAMTLLPVADLQRILFWGGGLVVINLIRAAITLGWRCDAQRLQRASTWWWYLLIGTVLGGAGWGLSDLLLFPTQNPSQQMLLVFITCGISSAAAVSLAVDRRIAWGFLIPCTLPLELQLYTHANGFGASLAAMGLVYLIFIAGVINRLHFYIKDDIVLRLAESEREQLQKEFAQALHSSQEKLQALFDLSPLGCILLRPDGSLVEANGTFKRMFGYSAEDFEASSNASLSSPIYRDKDRHRWQQLIQQGGVTAFESELIRKDGSTIPVSLHGMVFEVGDGQQYVWSLIENITVRKQNEEQLLALNNRLSLATQAGGIGIWEVDLVRDELVWDDRMYEIYGIERGQHPVTMDVPGGMMHPDDSGAIWQAFEAALLDPTVDHFVSEFRIVRRDDTERAVRQAGNIWRDESGRAIGLVGVLWDITEVRRVERMKSEFVSTVSHELRTPLTSIRGSLGLVASGVVGELPTAAQELIDIAYKNSERLSRLINDILDIEKIDSGKMHLDLQPQSLRSLMQQAVKANQGFAQSFSVDMTLSIDIDTTVVVDADRFMQVMANLISNAVKFSSAEDSVEIVAIDTAAHVRIEVRDRGPGVPADFQERIFLRFSQADSSDTRARGGSGLGLAISRTLMEKMHGKIGFAARAGGGTVFFVELPRQ